MDMVYQFRIKIWIQSQHKCFEFPGGISCHDVTNILIDVVCARLKVVGVGFFELNNFDLQSESLISVYIRKKSDNIPKDYWKVYLAYNHK
jgi:hypothetical protein